MIITISTRNKQLKDREQIYIESISTQLAEHFSMVISLRWKLNLQQSNIVVKCQLHAKSGYYRAEAKADDLKKAVNLIFDKITKQRRRKKQIQKKVKRRITIQAKDIS